MDQTPYDFNAYQSRIMQRAKPLPFETDLQHAYLGLQSEAGEICDAAKAAMIYGKPLDTLNLIEEGGDGMWFASLLARLLKFDFNDLCRLAQASNSRGEGKNLISDATRMSDAAAYIGCAIDDLVTNRRPLHLPRVASELARYLISIRKIAQGVGVELATVAEVNDAKLAFRYGGNTFNAQKGLNRDKAAEREVMQAVLDQHLGAAQAA